MTIQSTVMWLKIASAIVIGFGALLALVPIPLIASVVTFLADMLFLPLDGAQDISAPETRLVTAIGSGVMVGWGVLFWMVSTKVFPKDPHLARTMLRVSIWVWFIVDSSGSVAAGAWFNAIANTSFLFLFLVPLWRVDLSGIAPRK